jgi:FkbH-like protein
MFQYEWFDRQGYQTLTANDESHIEADTKFRYQINRQSNVRISDWQEHCLECAPPHCYNSCPIYVKRPDGKCRRLSWGIFDRKSGEVDKGYSADIRFNPWGKLETRVYPGVIKQSRHKLMDRASKCISYIIYKISFALKMLSPSMKLSGAYTYFKDKALQKASIGNDICTDHFLFQCYSFNPDVYQLLLDVADEETLIFRSSITVHPGINENMIQLPSHIQLPKRGFVRLYPENDIEARMIIYFCDFIEYAEKKQAKTTDQNAAPASKIKCVVWDLDNTVWNGILTESEDGILMLRESVLDTMKALDERGILQSVSSKNDYEPAVKELKRLGIAEYFLYPMINWGPKSANIKEIAKELDIDLNTFCLIDDSAFERAEVKAAIPQMRVMDETEVAGLFARAEFDVPATDDSRSRREMYMTEIKRKAFKLEKDENIYVFLRDCQIRIMIEPLTDNDPDKAERSFELINRTNQLNLSGNKYTREEFEALIRNEKYTHLCITCWDRFGKYGQVVYLAYSVQGSDIAVFEFAMSCRVAEKCIENAVIDWFLDKVVRSEDGKLVFCGNKTPKNSRLIQCFLNAGLISENLERTDRFSMSVSKRNAEIPNADIVKIVEGR